MKQNFEICDGEAIIKINKNIYSKEVLLAAAYVKLEDYYFLIDEEGENYLISLSFKDESKNVDESLKGAVYEFFDELIESASYIDQLKRTSSIREKILSAALLGQKKK